MCTRCRERTDRNAQHEFAVKTTVRHEEPTIPIHRVDQALRCIVAIAMGDAHQVQRRLDHEHERRVRANAGGEILRHINMLAHQRTQAADAKRTQDEPEFERAKSPAQRHLPIAVVGHAA